MISFRLQTFSSQKDAMYREKVIDPATLPHHRIEHLRAPVVALAEDYPHGTVIAPHRHDRAQFLYAVEGVMLVRSASERWLVPPNRGVWLAAGTEHSVRMSGNVKMRTAFVATNAVPALPTHSRVLDVSPLLRALLLAVLDVRIDGPLGGRDERLMLLLLDEIRAAPTLALHLPWPRDKRLVPVCERLVKLPAEATLVSEWAHRLGISVKTFHRLFQRETRVTFGRWRQQARLMLALEQLAAGNKVVDVALAHGYGNASAFAAMFKRHFGVTPTAFYD